MLIQYVKALIKVNVENKQAAENVKYVGRVGAVIKLINFVF